MVEVPAQNGPFLPVDLLSLVFDVGEAAGPAAAGGPRRGGGRERRRQPGRRLADGARAQGAHAVAQLLVYPIAGYEFDTPSYRENSTAKPLDKACM